MAELLPQAMKLADTYAQKRARFAAYPFTSEADENAAEQQMDAARAALESFLSEHLTTGVNVDARAIVGWVRDDDGHGTEPAFLRGSARPPRDFKGNYRPVVYDTAAGVVEGKGNG